MSGFSRKERGECCQCENVANAQSQFPIETGNIGTGNTSTMATFSSLPKRGRDAPTARPHGDDFNAEARRRGGWEVKPLRAFLSPVSVRNRSDAQLLSVTREAGVIVRNTESKEENHNYIPDDLSNYKFVEKGQFVINKMKAWQGSYGVSPYDGIVSPAYFVYDLDFPCKEFFSLAIRSKAYVQYFQRFSKGIRVDQWDLMPEALKLIPFTFPPLPEQKAIVAYLDAETGRIDKAIAAEEKMIALLQERREIVINEAVGGGEDFNAETQRRRGWEERRFGWIMSIKPSISAPHEELLSVFLHKGVIRFIEESEKRTNVTSTDLSKYQLVEPGDFVMNNQQAWRGSVGVSQCRGIVSPAYFVMRLANCLKSDFANYLLRSRRVVSIFERCSRGVGTIQRNLIWDMLKVCRIAFPPLPEQEEIVKRLDAETGKIDRAIEVKRRQIELLRERRQIVVDEAVRGCCPQTRATAKPAPQTRRLAKPGAALQNHAGGGKGKGGA